MLHSQSFHLCIGKLRTHTSAGAWIHTSNTEQDLPRLEKFNPPTFVLSALVAWPLGTFELETWRMLSRLYRWTTSTVFLKPRPVEFKLLVLLFRMIVVINAQKSLLVYFLFFCHSCWGKITCICWKLLKHWSRQNPFWVHSRQFWFEVNSSSSSSFLILNFLRQKTTEHVLGRIPRHRPVLKTRENKRASVVPCLSHAGKYTFVPLCVFLPSLFISFCPNTPKVSVEGFTLERHGKGSKSSS